MKVLLTGGTGFLGKTVAARLLAAGHEARLLVRRGNPRRELPDGVETAPGDVTDRDSLARAAQGCQAMLHMAALVKMWMPDRGTYDAVNVGGLENALAVASAAGIRLVYTSSFIAVGPAGPVPVDESRVHPGAGYRNDYERTKALADRVACQAAAAGGDVVIVYPGVVYGPGERTDGNIVSNMIADHFRGAFPGIVGPGDRLWSYSYVDDVAAGHVAALERGRRGERYFLCGENVGMVEFFRTLEKVSGVAAPRRHIPYAAASGLGFALWLWAELTGHPPRLTHEVVGVFREHWAYSSEKAKAELGYRPRSLEEGLARTVTWLRGEARG